MEIKIISTEIIKPSSPTPDHLRTHKLYYEDNTKNPHFPMVVFYPTKEENPDKISSHLKNSLSKTVTYYYPFAGQIKDGASIHCNDHGVFFIITQVVTGEMSEVVKKTDKDLLKQLLPLKGNMQEIPTTYVQSNLIVQVNYVVCGGIAISICFNHLIADGATASYFVKIWAEVAHGADDIKNVAVDHSSIPPPYDITASLARLYEQNRILFNPSDGVVTKTFNFDSRKVATLKEKIGNGPYLYHPTRFEAIATLVSGTLLKNIVDRKKHEFTAAIQFVVVIIINLRDKANPPLPPQCMGNLVATKILQFSIDEESDCNIIAARIRESVKNTDDLRERIMPGGDLVEGPANIVVFYISDMSKFPYYEADFGWGKPTWLSFVYENFSFANLRPTSNGEGVELTINLPKEEMAKFEQDPEILTYTQ